MSTSPSIPSPTPSSQPTSPECEAEQWYEAREDIFSRIHRFNHKVVAIGERKLSPLVLPEANWLRQALEEEAKELIESYTSCSDQTEKLVAQVDACVDAAVFAIGGLVRLGLTPRQITDVFHAVMDANFTKRAGAVAGREGAPDAAKPEGWVGPEGRIKEILDRG